MRYQFRFRAIPFVATVLLVALGVALGQWQDRRGAEKTRTQAMLTERAAAAPVVLDGTLRDPAAMEWRRVSVTGEFVGQWPIFLNNRPIDGKVGFYLVMPFKIAGSSRQVLVARGWLPRYTGEHDRLPPFATPAGTVVVQGVARRALGNIMQLGEPTPLAPKAIVQNLAVADYASAAKVEVQPFFIEQTTAIDAGDQLVRNWPAPALGVEKHQGYAFQWYALAVMAFLFFVITGFRRGPN